MIEFFMTKSCDIYEKAITPAGAGDEVSWDKKRIIKAFLEPVDGEKLLGTALGNDISINLILYTKSKITAGERVYIDDTEHERNGWFEIRHTEFYKMPFLNYYKGYLVKTDENI